MAKVVIHTNKTNAELVEERREVYMSLSPAERIKATLQMYRLTLLFSKENKVKRKALIIKK